MNLYKIRDWQKNFENNRSRDVKDLRWVPVPNKHDGEGFRYVMSQPDGLLIYGAWHLILQVASKCHHRGTLMRDDGTPMSARAIAVKTGWLHEKDIQRALDFCSSQDVGWIDVESSETPMIPPQTSVQRQLDGIPTAAERQALTEEGKGIEGNGKKGIEPPISPKGDEKREWLPNAEQLRLGALFNQRPSTPWSAKMVKAWKSITPIDEDDLAQLERHFCYKRKPADKFPRHTALETLLNNFQTAVDWARQFKEPTCL